MLFVAFVAVLAITPSAMAGTRRAKRVSGMELLNMTLLNSVAFANHSGDGAQAVLRTGLSSALNTCRPGAQQIHQTVSLDVWDRILVVLLIGGRHSKADWVSIQNSWGRFVRHGILMTNTPTIFREMYVSERDAFGSRWKLAPSNTLEGGSSRRGSPFWNALLRIVHAYLHNHPDINIVLRSDSDTWWNVPKLARTTAGWNASDPIVSGQAYGLPPLAKLIHNEFKPFRIPADNSKISPRPARGGDRGNVYLTGGAGLIFTKAAIENVYTHVLSGGCKRYDKEGGNEDLWICLCAFSLPERKLTLVPSEFMYQQPVNSKVQIKDTVAVHRAIGLRSNFRFEPYRSDTRMHKLHELYDVLAYSEQCAHCHASCLAKTKDAPHLAPGDTLGPTEGSPECTRCPPV